MAVSADNSTHVPQIAKPRRRWYQFTLRTAGVWMVLLCILGSFAWWCDRAERQRRVVEELREMGAKVEYRFNSYWGRQSNEVHARSQEYLLSYWLRCCLGDDFLYDVDSVSLASSYDSASVRPETTRSAIPLLNKCRHLKVLVLEANAVNGADLEQFPFLESLEVLSIFSSKTGIHTQLQDSDFSVLERATQLRKLYLDRLPIGDATTQFLCGLKRLQSLSLSETKVTDQGLNNLSKLSELEELDLRHTLITDAGLRHFCNLNLLADLKLSENAITGEGFADIGIKPELTYLDVRDTKFTDSALRHLLQFPKLRLLYLESTQINGQGIPILGGLDAMSGIRLNGCPVTDESIANVEVPNGWEYLSLSGTRITDQGVAKLKLPSSLKKLWLENSAVTDASLDNLQRFPKLEWVIVGNTRVTPDAIKRFQAQHPAGEAIY